MRTCVGPIRSLYIYNEQWVSPKQKARVIRTGHKRCLKSRYMNDKYRKRESLDHECCVLHHLGGTKPRSKSRFEKSVLAS